MVAGVFDCGNTLTGLKVVFGDPREVIADDGVMVMFVIVARCPAVMIAIESSPVLITALTVPHPSEPSIWSPSRMVSLSLRSSRLSGSGEFLERTGTLAVVKRHQGGFVCGNE